MTPVSLIGLGNMGIALGKCLLESGHSVHVWNRTGSRARLLGTGDVTSCASPSAAVTATNLIVLCLSDYLACEEALSSVSADDIRDRTLVQLTLMNAEQSLRLRDWVRDRGGRFLQGFIKAYPREIGTATASLMYAGSEMAFTQHSPTLAVLGRPHFVGASVEHATIVNGTGVALMQTAVGSFFEAAACALRAGVSIDQLEAMLPHTLRIVQATLERSCQQLKVAQSIRGPAQEAAVDVHAAALRSAVTASLRTGVFPALMHTALARLDYARSAGLGDCEIAVMLQVYDSVVAD